MDLGQISRNIRRTDHINWDEYFVAMMLLRAQHEGRGVDSNVALVLNARQIIIGMANEALAEPSNNLEPHFSHAEMRAIKDAEPYNVNKVNCTMYTTAFPCEECARAAIRNGISEIVYVNDGNIDENSRSFLITRGIKFRKFSTNKSKLEIDFSRTYRHLPLTP